MTEAAHIELLAQVERALRDIMWECMWRRDECSSRIHSIAETACVEIYRAQKRR